MKAFLLILIGFVLGGIVGVLGGGAIGTGIGAGAGIVTGMQAGACLTVEAAKEKGLITGEQVAQVFAAAAEMMQGEVKTLESDLGTKIDIADTDAECQAVVAKLKQAAADAE
jgi:hypothetical protein